MILLRKLTYYGIAGTELIFFSYFIREKAGCFISSASLVKEQSILVCPINGVNIGGVCFRTYNLPYIIVNDLSQNIHLKGPQISADDCVIYHAGYTVDDVNCKLLQSFNDVEKWYTWNGWVLNEEKCNTILIGSTFPFSWWQSPHSPS